MLRISTHPGEFLQEVYLKPNGISITVAADSMGVSPSTLSRLIRGDFDLSPSMAVRLSKYVGNSAEQWSNLQLNYSINKAYEKVGSDLILEAEIKSCVKDAWQKELSGKSVYLSNDEVAAMMSSKISELRK